jgi:hypothetical protein
VEGPKARTARQEFLFVLFVLFVLKTNGSDAPQHRRTTAGVNAPSVWSVDSLRPA